MWFLYPQNSHVVFAVEFVARAAVESAGGPLCSLFNCSFLNASWIVALSRLSMSMSDEMNEEYSLGSARIKAIACSSSSRSSSVKPRGWTSLMARTLSATRAISPSRPSFSCFLTENKSL